MTLTKARELAAQAWAAPANSDKELDPNLAEAFAEILMKEVNKALIGAQTNE